MRIKYLLSLFVLLLFRGAEVFAQCSQCKQAAAATDENGNLVVGTGLNFGILYLLAMPFVFAAVIGGVWFYKTRQAKLAQQTS